MGDLDEEVKKTFPNEDSFPQDLKDIRATTFAEIDVVVQHLDTAAQKLGQLQPKTLVEQQGSAEAIRKCLLEASESVFKEQVPVGNRSIGAYKAAYKRAAKEMMKSAKPGKKQNKDACLVATNLLLKHVKDNVQGSVNVAVVARADDVSRSVPSLVACDAGMLADCGKHPGIQSMGRWLLKQVGKEGKSPTAMGGYRPQVGKQVGALVKKHCAPLVSSIAVRSEQAALMEEIFGVQQWVMTEQHLHIAPLAYGVSEVRFLAAGSYLAAGVRLESLKGSNMKEKMDGLATDAGLKDFVKKAAISGEGFVTLHEEAGTCLVIPAGYVVAISGKHSEDEDGASGLRWGSLDINSEAEVKLTAALLDGMAATYPDMSSPGSDYASWRDCVRRLAVATTMSVG